MLRDLRRQLGNERGIARVDSARSASSACPRRSRPASRRAMRDRRSRRARNAARRTAPRRRAHAGGSFGRSDLDAVVADHPHAFDVHESSRIASAASGHDRDVRRRAARRASRARAASRRERPHTPGVGAIGASVPSMSSSSTQRTDRRAAAPAPASSEAPVAVTRVTQSPAVCCSSP